ncbi:MAG: hypothetical protein RMK29_17375 [Myxococcales bacterium]|nr:hypothetical protein [Myxococcota bacterium]MDW8283482.1 hypothetical protein [Myxococcales bacterium]
MALQGIPPLDLQTEHLDRSQYPSLRLLLVVAAIISSLLIVTWVAHRDTFAVSGQMAAGQQASPAPPAAVDRELISRAIPLRP